MSASWVTREAAFRGKLEDGQSQGGFQSKVEALAWVVLATPGAAGERARAMVSSALPKPEAKSKDDAEGKGNAGKAEEKENKAKGKDAGGDEAEGKENKAEGKDGKAQGKDGKAEDKDTDEAEAEGSAGKVEGSAGKAEAEDHDGKAEGQDKKAEGKDKKAQGEDSKAEGKDEAAGKDKTKGEKHVGPPPSPRSDQQRSGNRFGTALASSGQPSRIAACAVSQRRPRGALPTTALFAAGVADRP